MPYMNGNAAVCVATVSCSIQSATRFHCTIPSVPSFQHAAPQWNTRDKLRMRIIKCYKKERLTPPSLPSGLSPTQSRFVFLENHASTNILIFDLKKSVF